MGDIVPTAFAIIIITCVLVGFGFIIGWLIGSKSLEGKNKEGE